MYEYSPKRTNTAAQRLILLFFLGAAALILITMLVPTVPFRWVFQLIAIGLLTAAIFLVTRYVTKLFLYRIENGDLTVTEADARGKRQITVCRVSVANIQSLERLDEPNVADAALSDLKKQKIKLFDYTADLRPADSILLVVREGGEDLAIRLSFDEILFGLLGDAEEMR